MAVESVNALRWAARDCSGLLSPFAFSRNVTSLKNPMINSDKMKKRQQLAIVAETRLPVKASAVAETLLPVEDGVLAETQLPVKAAGWAAWDTTGVLSPFKFSRRETGPYDVQFKVMYCGICHSDLHFLKNEWAQTIYPIVPGHEVVGIVTEVGPQVTKVKVGDKVGVGCMVNSCRKCHNCSDDLENYCPNAVFTYNSTDVDGTNTYGGYSNIMVANEHMIVKWPESLPLTGAPLLCAGITTYSAMKYYGVNKPGLKVGVVGLGGLGHVAVRFAKAFGMKVTVISSSSHKKDEALEHFGAHGFLNSRDTDEMAAAAGSLDAIVDTVSATHPMQPLLSLLKTSGKLVMVGLPEKPLSLPAMPLISGRKMLGGSMIGGMKETQEMIDFAAEHNIMPDVEVVPMNYVNKAFERLEKGDVKYRFVLDIGNTMDDDVVKEETTSCSISL